MNDIFYMAITLIAGLLIGAVYFGGLWLTVRKAVAATIPALWFAASFLLRMAIALAGFYLAGQGNWQRFLVCLAGFVVARLLVARMTKPAGHSPFIILKEK